MNFKDMLEKISQLSEATKTTDKGRVHTAEPGGYGRKYDTDEEGDEKKKDAPAAKRGRGRPKKGSDDSGEVKKYDFSAFGVKHGKDVKLPKHDKSKTTKHSLKEYFEELDAQVIAEMVPTGMKPLAILDPKNKQAGAGVVTSKNPAVQKMLGNLDPKDVQIVMTQATPSPNTGMNPAAKPGQQQPTQATPYPNTGMNPAIKPGQQQVSEKEDASDDYSAKKARAGKDIGKPGKQYDESVDEGQLDELSPQTLSSYGRKAAGQANWAGGVAKALGGRPEEKQRYRDSNVTDPSANYGPEGNKYAKFSQKRFAGVRQAIAKGANVNPGNIEPYDYARKGGYGDTSNPAIKEQDTTEGSTGDYSAKKARAGKDIGKPGKQFAKIAKSAAERYGSKERGEKVAGAVLAKLRAKTNEADQPPHDSLASPLTLEGKGSKPDFLDLDKDGNKKESMKKAAQDKKKVKEGMDHRLKSARHAGKAHALAKEAYNCRYDDMEEAKHYHEGYKEGLDECYGQMPIQGYVGETTPPATVPGMASQAMKQPAMEDALTEGNTEKRTASQWLADPKLDTQVMQLQVDGINITNTSKGLKGFADGGRGYPYPAEPFTSAKNPMYFKDFLKYVMGKLGDVEVLGFLQAGPGMANQAMKQPAMEDDLDEMDKGDWMKHKAKTTPGDTFKAFGQTFKDKEVTESPFAFEAWDKELNALLESKEDVSEGMSVSISKGQQGAPDSVSVTAQDAEAEQLLGLIKQAGLGLFGGDEPNGYGAPQGDTPQHGGVDVVGDHDGMMALIKKVTGGEQGNADYADEEGREETCEVCHESSCGCDEGQEMVDEVESEDQMTYQVAEDNPPDSGAHDTEIEVQDTAQMNKSGAAYNPKNDVDEGAGGPEASEEPVEPMVSEESDEEEDDHAEKAGEKVTKDIEYDDKEDKKKGDKLDEWANDAGKKGTDTTFETDIEFMMNVISGGLNKRKQTGQTTIPVISSQLNRQVAHTTTDINESTDPVSEWKKLAGI